MVSNIPPNIMMPLKKVLYLLMFGPAYMPYAAVQNMHLSGYYDFFAWWVGIGFFCVAPIMDHIIGRDLTSSHP